MLPTAGEVKTAPATTPVSIPFPMYPAQGKRECVLLGATVGELHFQHALLPVMSSAIGSSTSANPGMLPYSRALLPTFKGLQLYLHAALVTHHAGQ